MATVLGSNRNDFRWCQNLNEKSDCSWSSSLLATHPVPLWETRGQKWVQGSCCCRQPQEHLGDVPPTTMGWWADLICHLKAQGGAAKISGRVQQSMYFIGHIGMCMSNRRKTLKIQPRLLPSLLPLFVLIFVSYSFSGYTIPLHRKDVKMAEVHLFKNSFWEAEKLHK